MSDVLTVLKGVRQLLQTKKAWTKRWFARKSDGSMTNSENREACCWCLQGAINRVGCTKKFLKTDVVGVLIENLPRGYSDIVSFNDSSQTTHQDILNLLDTTIDKLSLPQGKE